MTMTIPISEGQKTCEARVISYLEGMGYQALKQTRRTGKSGLEQNFDILAQKDDGFTLRVIAIEIISSDNIDSAISCPINVLR